MNEINSSILLTKCDCSPLTSRLPTTLLTLSWSEALLLQPHAPTLCNGNGLFPALPMPCLSFPPGFSSPTGLRVTSQKSTSDLIILTLTTCYPSCYSEVQIPYPDTGSPAGFGPSPALQPRPHPSPPSTLPGFSHPKPQERCDTIAKRQVWSQPGCSSHLCSSTPLSLSFLIRSVGVIMAPTL